MQRNLEPRSSTIQVWIPVGAMLFIAALGVSGWVVPQLRLLHLLQAVIYVAVVILGWRNSAWGFGVGFTVALVWNSLNLVVTHLMQAGVVAFWVFLRTGEARRTDTMAVALGGIGHFILIIACLAAAFRQRTEERKWLKFAGGGAVALVYFFLIVELARPQ